jgi:hypothetical protein
VGPTAARQARLRERAVELRLGPHRGASGRARGVGRALEAGREAEGEGEGMWATRSMGHGGGHWAPLAPA